MITDFQTSNQNYKEVLTMIEETRKDENEDLGNEIIKLADELKAKRDKCKPKKNFLHEHNKTLKKWHEVQYQQ